MHSHRCLQYGVQNTKTIMHIVRALFHLDKKIIIINHNHKKSNHILRDTSLAQKFLFDYPNAREASMKKPPGVNIHIMA